MGGMSFDSRGMQPGEPVRGGGESLPHSLLERRYENAKIILYSAIDGFEAAVEREETEAIFCGELESEALKKEMLAHLGESEEARLLGLPDMYVTALSFISKSDLPTIHMFTIAGKSAETGRTIAKDVAARAEVDLFKGQNIFKEERGGQVVSIFDPKGSSEDYQMELGRWVDYVKRFFGSGSNLSCYTLGVDDLIGNENAVRINDGSRFNFGVIWEESSDTFSLADLERMFGSGPFQEGDDFYWLYT